jgi:hypothetical protein
VDYPSSIKTYELGSDLSYMKFSVNHAPTGSREVLHLMGSGYVGIGTDSPESPLNVNGAVVVTGSIVATTSVQASTLKVTQGAQSGSILTSDSAGNAAWSTLGSLGLLGSGSVQSSTTTGVGPAGTLVNLAYAYGSTNDYSAAVLSATSGSMDVGGWAVKTSASAITLYANGASSTVVWVVLRKTQ